MARTTTWVNSADQDTPYMNDRTSVCAPLSMEMADAPRWAKTTPSPEPMLPWGDALSSHATRSRRGKEPAASDQSRGGAPPVTAR
eukprot:7187992-Prymnesium_polylepis.1